MELPWPFGLVDGKLRRLGHLASATFAPNRLGGPDRRRQRPNRFNAEAAELIERGPLSTEAALSVGLAFLIQWLVFIPSFLLQTEKYFDLTGSITYITVTGVALCYTRYTVALDARSILVAALVIVFGEPVIRLIYGHAFSDHRTAITLLALVPLAAAFVSSVGRTGLESPRVPAKDERY